MDGLNYNHLYYFWMVARQGSISRASHELQLSQPTISEQLRKLEEEIGTPLFDRVGRGLRLTSAGDITLRYADKIFSLGQDLTKSLNGEPGESRLRFAVGIARGLPEIVTPELLNRAATRLGNYAWTCTVDRTDTLLSALQAREFDLVLMDRADAARPFELHATVLQRSGISFLARKGLVPVKARFPQLLDGVPMALPEETSSLSDSLQRWFRRVSVVPQPMNVSGNLLLLTQIAALPIPTSMEQQVRKAYKLEVLGRTDEVQIQFVALTKERNPRHPAVRAILNKEVSKSSGRRKA